MKNTARTALQIARIAFPSWTGRKAKIADGSTVNMYGMAWSEGSRNEYAAVNLTTGEVAAMPRSMSTPRELGGSDGDYKVTVPAGFAVVCSAIFCGRDCGCTVYLGAPAALASAAVLELA